MLNVQFRYNTPKNAVIAGSMQLLAGVKLCTGRILTNHPHYEDKALRERTKQVMAILSRPSFVSFMIPLTFGFLSHFLGLKTNTYGAKPCVSLLFAHKLMAPVK